MWHLKETRQEVWAWCPVFTPDECKQIITIGTQENLHLGTVSSDNKIDDIRNSKITWIKANDSTAWIYQRCTSVVLDMNQRFFNYDLEYIQDLQFTMYSTEHPYYGKHVDILDKKAGAQRKLTFSIQLSDPSEYDGGELLLHYQNTPTTGVKEIGNGTFFPSHTLHEVTPVTTGIRYSLIGWVAGPNLR